jgi:uncharacterized membrane protein
VCVIHRKIAWVAVAGSVKELIGSYEFERVGDSQTRIRYQLAIDPGFPLPGMVKQASAKLIVSTALNELRKHTEKEATRMMLRDVIGARQLTIASAKAAASAGQQASSGAGAMEASSGGAVEAASIKVKAVVVPSAASESVEKTIEVGASVEECFEAAAGFEEYPKWAGSVQYVKVLDKTEQGLGKTVEYAVGAFGRTLGYTLSYEFEYPR